MVQTMKGLLQKCKESGQGPHVAMLCLRSTSLSHDLSSPAELLNGRVYQRNLPAVSKQSFSTNGDINAKLQVRQEKQKAQYDKTTKQPLHMFFPEDRVSIFNPTSSKWEPGIVQDESDGPRSYVVATEKGGIRERNRRYLRRTEESFQFSRSDVPEDIPIADAPLQAMTKKNVEKAVTLFPLKMVFVLLPASESVSPSSTVNPTLAPPRRSSASRKVKAPERMNL